MPRCHGYRRPEASQAHGGSPWARGQGDGSTVRSQELGGAAAARPVNGRPHTSSHRAGRSSIAAPPSPAMGLRWEEGVHTGMERGTRRGWRSKVPVVGGGYPHRDGERDSLWLAQQGAGGVWQAPSRAHHLRGAHQEGAVPSPPPQPCQGQASPCTRPAMARCIAPGKPLENARALTLSHLCPRLSVQTATLIIFFIINFFFFSFSLRMWLRPWG